MLAVARAESFVALDVHPVPRHPIHPVTLAPYHLATLSCLPLTLRLPACVRYDARFGPCPEVSPVEPPHDFESAPHS